MDLFECVRKTTGHVDAILNLDEHCKLNTLVNHALLKDVQKHRQAFVPTITQCVLSHRTTNVKFVTVLRDPLTRYLSAIRFFGAFRHITDQVREFFTTLKYEDTHTQLRKLHDVTRGIFAPLEFTKPDVLFHEYTEVLSAMWLPPGEAERRLTERPPRAHSPHPPNFATSRAQFVERRPSPRAHPERTTRDKKHLSTTSNMTKAEQDAKIFKLPDQPTIDRAKDVLTRFFVVGLTEAMDEFVALLSLEFGWPLRDLCLPAPCRLARKVLDGGKTCVQSAPKIEDRLPPAVHKEMRRLVAPDTQVHEHAWLVHRALAARHGAHFSETLSELQSEKRQAYCKEKRETELAVQCPYKGS